LQRGESERKERERRERERGERVEREIEEREERVTWREATAVLFLAILIKLMLLGLFNHIPRSRALLYYFRPAYMHVKEEASQRWRGVVVGGGRAKLCGGRAKLRPLSTLTLSCTNTQHRHWARQSM